MMGLSHLTATAAALVVPLFYFPIVNGAQIDGNCLAGPIASWLNASTYTTSALIACKGSSAQIADATRYWGTQFGKNASIVVYPGQDSDVAALLGLISNYGQKLDFSFVSGGHSQINASSANDLTIDLSYMKHIDQLWNSNLGGTTQDLVSFQAGVTTGDLVDNLAGSGRTVVTARYRSVGAGFNAGGGIGFLASAYGYACDRIVQAEVALASGQIVTASATVNSDLFWALHGGTGQFGIVTKFWVKAAPEPSKVTYSAIYFSAADTQVGRQNVVDFYNKNNDPFSLLYYTNLFTPGPGGNANDPSQFAARTVIINMRFQDPTNPNQPSFNTTFGGVTKGLNSSVISPATDIPYSQSAALFSNTFPTGFRRGFYGPQVSSPSLAMLNSASDIFNAYIQEALAAGEFPATALWGLQYVKPAANLLPKLPTDTAWPHNAGAQGHQTLFSPAQLKASNDPIIQKYTSQFNSLVYSRQTQTGITIPDYPNYISPAKTVGMSKVQNGITGFNGARLWGANVARLVQIKQKYDPQCIFRKGAVFSSPGCVQGGYATVF